MKKHTLILLLPILFLLSRCGVNKQIEQAKNLGNCQFDVVAVDSVNLSGISMNQFKDEEINLGSLPRLAIGILSRNVPLSAHLELRIMNPTGQTAAIDQFEYKILLRNNEIFNGYVNHKVVVPAGGGQIVVPVHIFANAYQLFADKETHEDFNNLIANLSGAKNVRKSVLTLKIRPTIDLGGQKLNYPGYITFNKEIGRD